MIDIQRRATELGRIRLGEKGPKGEPRKLTQFRLTSASRPLLEAAAQLYGGQVKPWPEAPDQGMWQLHTTSAELDVWIIPGFARWSSKYELWDGPTCSRRCNGQIEELSDGPCLCDSDDRECRPVTRLSVVLPRVPGVGVWRFESHGYNAAAKLPATLELLTALGRSDIIPAVLRADQQSKVVELPADAQHPKPRKQTLRWVEPALDLPQFTMGDLLSAAAALPDSGSGPRLLTATTPEGTTSASLGPGPSRPPRETKVERPALGPAPSLPERSDFRKPDEPPVMPRTAEPPQVAGWALDDDTAADPSPLPSEPGQAVSLPSAPASPAEASDDTALSGVLKAELRGKVAAYEAQGDEWATKRTIDQGDAIRSLNLPDLPTTAAALGWRLPITRAQAQAILDCSAEPGFRARWDALVRKVGQAA